MGDVIDLSDQNELTRSSVVQAVYDFLQHNLPSGNDGVAWQPATGSLDDLIINAFGQEADELAYLLSAVSTSAFRYLGQKVHKVPPIDPVQATGTVAWNNGSGFVISVPAGTLLSIDGVAFALDDDLTIPPVTTVDATVTAVNAGAAANGLGASVIIRDNLSSPPLVAMVGPTAGGSDGEDDDTYLARLVDELQMLSRAAITVDDFSRIVQRVDGVHRVLVLPHHDPDSATPDDAPGFVTLIAQDDSGAGIDPLSATGLAIAALFADDSRAIVPITVKQAQPTVFPITVAATVEYWPGNDPGAVVDQVNAQIVDFLDPAAWGAPRSGDPDSGQGWIDDRVVSALGLAGAIERGDTVRRVLSISINGGADRTDYTMGTAATYGALPSLSGTPVITPQAVS
jgi:hypothetical protein